MIDLHSHILIGLDDGAKTVEDSLAMAKQAVSEGIHTVVATPHHMNGKYENNKQNILQRVEELNNLFKSEQIPLDVLPGQEVRLYGDIIVDFLKDEILTMNDGRKYIFVELPTMQVPLFTDRILMDLQMEGLKPVIVHPERNHVFLNNPDMLYDIVTRGVLTQVTAASVTGAFGKKIKRFSMQLLEANLTHFIASDAHNTTTRNFKMAEALEVIESKMGIDSVENLLNNAHLLIDNKSINSEYPNKIKQRKFLGLF